VPLSCALNPKGIATLPCGALLVSCDKTFCVYLVQPTTGHCTRIAGTGECATSQQLAACPGSSATFSLPWGVALAPPEQCVYVTDMRLKCIRRIALPPELFVRPHVTQTQVQTAPARRLLSFAKPQLF
jgi:hypothetical protein